MKRTSVSLTLFTLTLLVPAPAGSQQSPVFALHVQPRGPDTSQACLSKPSIECTQYNVAGELRTPYDVYLVAAGVDNSNLGGISGASCGIEYDPAPGSGVRVVDWYFCTDGLQFPNVGPHGPWPASGSGNRMTWTTCQDQYTGQSIHAVFGAFYVYAYSADELRVIPNRNLGSGSELRVSNCPGSEFQVDTTGVSTAVVAFGGGIPYNPCSDPGICEVFPAAYDFGDVPSGQSSDLTVTVSNAGPPEASPLPLDIQTGCDDFEIVSGGGMVLVPPGNVHEFVVRFAPTMIGNNTCVVDIWSGGCSLELVGNARPEIGLGGEGVASSSAAFSTRWASTQHSLPALAVPDGGGTLEVAVTGLFGSDAVAAMYADGHQFWVRGSGSGCGRRTMSFPLSPAKLARMTADGVVEVRIKNYDIEPTCPVNLHEVSLRYESGPGPIHFGQVVPGETRTRGIPVTNSGYSDLEVAGVDVVGDGFEADPSPITVPPGSSHVVAVEFSPLLSGDHAGTLFIRSNDPDDAELTVTLHGVGFEVPRAVLSPTELVFDLPAREDATQTVVLSNEGGDDLTFEIDPPSPPPPIGSGRMALHALSLVSKSEICSPEPSGPMPTMTPCSEYNVEADLLTPTTVYLVVNTDSVGIGVGGVSCGLEYNGRPGDGVKAVDWKLCTDGLQFEVGSWPASGSGNRITWTTCQTNTIGSVGVQAVVGAFYLYSYSNDLFQITPNRNVGTPEYAYGTCQAAEVHMDPTRTPAVAFSAGAVVPGRNPCAEPIGGKPTRPLAHSLVPWLAVSPLSGVVPPGGTIELSVTASAANFGEGVHKSSVVLHTNDPGRRDLPLPVTVGVTGVPAGPVAATIDIEPGSFDPGLGTLWAMTLVELPPGYDPAAIRPETVRAMRVVPHDPDYDVLGDGNGNGVPDREFRFARGALLAALPPQEEVEVVVTGNVGETAVFRGADDIRITRPRLVSPNGGETLPAQGTAQIVWDTPQGWSPARVEIRYSPDGGESWDVVVAEAGTSPYPWGTPSEPTEEGRLLVSLFDDEGVLGMDASDGDFQVHTGVIDPEPVSRPTFFALHQNAPNPFTTSTLILYDLPEEQAVTLRLYDLRGRRLLELPQGLRPAGNHAVSWDGRDRSGRPVAAGIYFYELLAGPYRETRRMLVVR